MAVADATLEDTRSSGPYAILVADDDDGCRATLSGWLRERGFTTHRAACGEEAIEIAQSEPIDLAVFDLDMPRMTGLEALQQVRVFHSRLPALLVTAAPTPEVIRQARLAQVYSVLPKPVNPSLLLHMLVRALRGAYPARPAE